MTLRRAILWLTVLSGVGLGLVGIFTGSPATFSFGLGLSSGGVLVGLAGEMGDDL